MSKEPTHETALRTAQITHHDGRPDGLRTVSTLASILQVAAAPWADRQRLMASTGYLGPYRVYILDSDRIYVGHGDDHRVMGSHLPKQERDRTRHVFVIGSQDARFEKELANRLESRLIETAIRLGVRLANDNVPLGFSNGCRVPSDLDEVVEQACLLLATANFRRFTDPQPGATVPQLLPVNTNIDAVRVMPPGEITIPDEATPLVLACRDLRVEAYRVGLRLWVMPGSDYGPVCKSGVSADNRKRRELIEAAEILEPCPDRPGRMRLRLGLDFKRAALAAKVISGEHLRTKAWQPKTIDVANQPAAVVVDKPPREHRREVSQ